MIGETLPVNRVLQGGETNPAKAHSATMENRRNRDLAAVERLFHEHALDMKSLSLRIGANSTYIQQFIKYANPKTIGAKFRDRMAREFNLDPYTLDPLPEARETPNARMAHISSAALPLNNDMPQDVPVLGNGTGGADGAMNFGDPIDYIRRPPPLARSRDLYGVYVSGDSMEPRYFSGELLFVAPHRPVSIGDHVIVQCLNGNGEGAELVAFVKVVTGRKGNGWTFGQYNPEGPWVAPGPVKTVHRISTTADIYGV